MAKRIKVRKEHFGVPASVKRAYPNVKFVVDADEAVDIKVCKADVSSAKKLDPIDCALAKAAKRELKADAAIIGISTSYLIKGDKAVRFATPASVQREIVSFDRHSDFTVGEYYLTPKSPANRLSSGNTPSRNKTRGRGTTIHHRNSKTEKIRVLPKGQD